MTPNKKGYLLWLSVAVAVGAAIVMAVTADRDTMGVVGTETKEKKHTNRLSNEKSPYLLQHADNPVDWYPWGDEAFNKAKKEDKPIFLSIGYSTCHWCHVMEHESFEDEEVAGLLNAGFVSIKVDREERPDIDGIYMKVCQMMTGSGGWPLTIIMTPDKKPFFAGTYFPKKGRFGRPGLVELLPKVSSQWNTRRNDLQGTADEVTEILEQSTESLRGKELGKETLELAFQQLSHRYDAKYGGFGTSPKFPSPHNLLFLLRYWKRTGDEKALEMVEKTLVEMRKGGIYDHVGFGFHRYSTDSEWLVPHFEKMLYDQAMLTMAYVEVYQATGNEDYARTAKEIVTYVLRDLTSAEGVFYSAEDADSEGEEGKFYIWEYSELKKVLDNVEVELAGKVFNADTSGNFTEEASGRKAGRNILHLEGPLGELASKFKMPEEEFLAELEAIRKKLFEYREKRVRPYRDDKVLTDWNGLMIAALSKAARALDVPEYADAAERAADLILEKLKDGNGRLLHRYREGEAAIAAHVDDYAFMVWGLLELYETTFDLKYLKAAIDLNDEMVAHFWDFLNGGFYFTADDAEKLLVRQKEIYDGAIPSGNSVAMLNMLRLSRITGREQLEEDAGRIAIAFSKDVSRAPIAYTQLMVALDFALGPSYEIVIAGKASAEDTKSMLEALRKRFIPNKVVILRPGGESPDIVEIAEFTKSQTSLRGKATAYVCHNYQCSRPTTDMKEMIGLLGIEPR